MPVEAEIIDYQEWRESHHKPITHQIPCPHKDVLLIGLETISFMVALPGICWVIYLNSFFKR